MDRRAYRACPLVVSAFVGLASLAVRPAPARAQGIRLFGHGTNVGQLHAPGTLRTIGGFDRVRNNPVLDQVLGTRGGPTRPYSIGGGERLFGGGGRTNPTSESLRLNQYNLGRGAYLGQQSRLGGPSARATDIGAGRREPHDVGQILSGRGGRGTGGFGLPRSGRYANSLGAMLARRSFVSGVPLTRKSVINRRLTERSLVGRAAVVGMLGTGVGDVSRSVVGPVGHVAVRHDTMESDELVGVPSIGVDSAASGSLESTVRRRLDSRVDAYIRRGWRAFHRGLERDEDGNVIHDGYRTAYDNFHLAVRLAPTNREATIGLIYAAIATGQYTRAAGALRHAIERVPDLLDNLMDIRDAYEDVRTFEAQYERFDTYVKADARGAQDPGAIALYAFVLWGRGDRTNARYHIQRVVSAAGSDSPYAQLARMMQQVSEQQTTPPSRAPRSPEDVLRGVTID
jgi:tetratricopeptide (TPR) repeat protein